MAGLVPAIHVSQKDKSWMPGVRPGMTSSERIALSWLIAG
jgi:hypothetical protein